MEKYISSDLILENLSKSFGEKCIFKGFNCRFLAKKINLICGDSGIGKTTLLRTICSLEKSDNDKFEMYLENGKNFTLSVLFQEDRLIENLSARRNILFALGKSKFSDYEMKKLEYLLEELNLKNELNNKVRNFSGGMKRRLALIRTLMKEADVYIFDEIFKGMDAKLKRKSLELIISELPNKLKIIVSHDDLLLKDRREIYSEEIKLIELNTISSRLESIEDRFKLKNERKFFESKDVDILTGELLFRLNIIMYKIRERQGNFDSNFDYHDIKKELREIRDFLINLSLVRLNKIKL